VRRGCWRGVSGVAGSRRVSRRGAWASPTRASVGPLTSRRLAAHESLPLVLWVKTREQHAGLDPRLVLAYLGPGRAAWVMQSVRPTRQGIPGVGPGSLPARGGRSRTVDFGGRVGGKGVVCDGWDGCWGIAGGLAELRGACISLAEPCKTCPRWGSGAGASLGAGGGRSVKVEVRAWGLLARRFWYRCIQAGLPAWRLGLANTFVSWPPDAAAPGGPREPTTRAVGENARTARGA
jgi:hypothetical protein